MRGSSDICDVKEDANDDGKKTDNETGGVSAVAARGDEKLALDDRKKSH
jgi:hypothetical protein